MLAVPVGLLASAILVVNNVRDLETDRRAGKRTLAVRLGRERARVLYAAMVAGAFVTAQLPVAASARCRRGCCCALLALPLAVPVVRVVRTRTDGPALNGALARTGPAAARVLPAALGGHPGELMGLDRRGASRCACATPLRAAWGTLRERQLLRVRLRGATTGSSAAARRRRWSPTTAYRSRRCAPRSTPTPCWRGERADGASCSTACRAERRPAAGARRRRPRAVGPRRQARRAPGRGAAVERGRARRSPSTRRSAPRTARARRRRPRPRRRRASTCVKVKVGVGDDAGRVAAVRAAVGPRVAIRVDANGAWDGRRGGRRRCARSRRPGSSWPRSRSTASRRCARCAPRSTCRSRWTRPPPRPGARWRRAPPTPCA